MDKVEQDAKELADKMDLEFFNRKLIDSTEAFMRNLNAQKKNLTKGDLLNLVKYIVKYPDVVEFPVNKNVVNLARIGAEAKDALVATTVQVLVEEGQNQATPDFKPEGE